MRGKFLVVAVYYCHIVHIKSTVHLPSPQQHVCERSVCAVAIHFNDIIYAVHAHARELQLVTIVAECVCRTIESTDTRFSVEQCSIHSLSSGIFQVMGLSLVL